MTNLWSTVLACCLGSAVATGADQAPPPLELHPAPTDKVLLNPGMGLYAQCGPHLGTVPDQAWWLDAVDLGYFRMNWSDLEPNGPDDDLGAYFGPIFDQWVGQMGKRVAFRVMSENTSTSAEYVTPRWVFDQGVPSVEHASSRQGAHQVDPIFWDERYLAAACAFVARLGAYLDGRPGLEFVDIGQIGEWGEMHVGLHIPGRWTPEQLDQTGFTRERYVAAYRRVIDAFAAAFPHTIVFLNVGDYAEINDYAALRGLHFRQDGLGPDGPSNNVGERFYRPYADRGVRCNYEFHSTYRSMVQKGWDLAQTLAVGLSVPLSYLNTNLFSVGELADAPPEARELLLDAARRIGFRFGLDQVSTRSQLRLRPDAVARLPVAMTWTNRGVAPCYESYALELGLLDSDGAARHVDLLYPAVPTTRWTPGQAVEVQHLLRVRPALAPGTYRLAVRMVCPERPKQRISLDLADEAGDGWYPLGEVSAEVVAGESGTVYEEDFEGADQAWHAAEGMTATVQDGGHAGRCLVLSGTQTGGWGFGAARVPVLGGARYKLEAWLRIDRLEPRRPITLKAGLNRADGVWLTNANTNAYALDRAGEWQRLALIFETPLDAASADLSVEKGGKETLTAELAVDEVRLELLESP